MSINSRKLDDLHRIVYSDTLPSWTDCSKLCNIPDNAVMRAAFSKYQDHYLDQISKEGAQPGEPLIGFLPNFHDLVTASTAPPSAPKLRVITTNSATYSAHAEAKSSSMSAAMSTNLAMSKSPARSSSMSAATYSARAAGAFSEKTNSAMSTNLAMSTNSATSTSRSELSMSAATSRSRSEFVQFIPSVSLNIPVSELADRYTFPDKASVLRTIREWIMVVNENEELERAGATLLDDNFSIRNVSGQSIRLSDIPMKQYAVEKIVACTRPGNISFPLLKGMVL